MYIKYNESNYPCKCNISKTTVTYKGLPEDFPHPVDGILTLCADDGFILRMDNSADYLRQTFSNNTLTLTNMPEVVVPDEPVVQEPTTEEILDALLGV